MGQIKLYFRSCPIIEKIEPGVNCKATPHCGSNPFRSESNMQQDQIIFQIVLLADNRFT
jgi:hypothetical protein